MFLNFDYYLSFVLMCKLNQLMCRIRRGLTGFNVTINVVQIYANTCNFKSFGMFLFHYANDYCKY